MCDPNENQTQGQLVISIDIGILHSATSYAYKLPNASQWTEPTPITDWPGAPDSANRIFGPTVPSLILYDSKGQATCFGFDVGKHRGDRGAQWTVISQFKRHVHRLESSTDSESNDRFQRQLQGISLQRIHEDWFKFLIDHTKSQITRVLGELGLGALWANRKLALVVPNGWNLPEKTEFGQLARSAGCVEDPRDITLIGESEMALQSILERKSLSMRNVLAVGAQFIVCNVGVATVDITLYHVKKVDPVEVQEVYGHPSISLETRLMSLTDSWLPEDYPIPMVDAGTIGPSESSAPHQSGVQVGVDKETARVANAILRFKGDKLVKLVAISGTFPPSLLDELANRLQGLKIKLLTLDPVQKNGANSAIHCWFENSASARALPHALGIATSVPYDPENPRHKERAHLVVRRNNGLFLNDSWKEVVSRGELSGVFRASYSREYNTNYPSLEEVRVFVYGCDRVNADSFIFDEDGNFIPGFHEICQVDVDMSDMEGNLTPVGKNWYALEFQLELSIEECTITALVKWESSLGTHTSVPVDIQLPQAISHEWVSVQTSERTPSPASTPEPSRTTIPYPQITVPFFKSPTKGRQFPTIHPEMDGQWYIYNKDSDGYISRDQRTIYLKPYTAQRIQKWIIATDNKTTLISPSLGWNDPQQSYHAAIEMARPVQGTRVALTNDVTRWSVEIVDQFTQDIRIRPTKGQRTLFWTATPAPADSNLPPFITLQPWIDGNTSQIWRFVIAA